MNENLTIFGRDGEPFLILHPNGRLVMFNGRNVGFWERDSIFDYGGQHRGWFENGVLRDHNGRCVGFLKGAKDNPSPFFPFPRISPFPQFPQFEPFRPIVKIKPAKPIKQITWSPFDPLSIFML